MSCWMVRICGLICEPSFWGKEWLTLEELEVYIEVEVHVEEEEEVGAKVEEEVGAEVEEEVGAKVYCT